MMIGDQLFVDTNILIYATDVNSPYYVRALDALNEARTREVNLTISRQVLREYLAVTTSLRLKNPAIHLTSITESIHSLRQEFTVVEDSNVVFDNLIKLLQSIPTAGKQVHDANIVATMQAHGIRSLLTHNTADFSRFSHLIELLDI